MLIYLTMIEAEEDRHRFLSLYRRYKKLMLYIAHDILHDPHDAEDAVHEAFCCLAEMIEKIHEIDCPETRSLIVMITKSKAIDLYRKKRRRAGTVPWRTGPPPHHPRPRVWSGGTGWPGPLRPCPGVNGMCCC